jgi:hypothetical protein
MPKSGARSSTSWLSLEKKFTVLPQAHAMQPAVYRLLEALEAPPVDEAARARLTRLLIRRGEAHIILLLRTILESDGNAAALVEPVINAVSSLMIFHPEWPGRGLAPGSRLSTTCRRAAAQKKRPRRGATGAVFAETVPWG